MILTRILTELTPEYISHTQRGWCSEQSLENSVLAMTLLHWQFPDWVCFMMYILFQTWYQATAVAGQTMVVLPMRYLDKTFSTVRDCIVPLSSIFTDSPNNYSIFDSSPVCNSSSCHNCMF